MKKEANLFEKSEPYTSAHYFQDNLRVFEVFSAVEEVSRKEGPHFHDEIEMLYLVEGNGTLTVNGVAFALEAGSMAWLLPFHVHAIEPAAKRKLKMYVCRYSLGMLIYLKVDQQHTPLSIAVLEYGPPCLQLAKEEQPQARALFEDILAENESRDLAYELVLFSSLLRLVAIFQRKATAFIEKTGHAPRTLAWNAFEYLQLHFNKDIDSASLAAQFGISSAELNRVLRALTGKNFSQNLHDARIRNACAMMQFGELSILYIARAVGYSSPAAFHRQFKAIKGATPDRYRFDAIRDANNRPVYVSDSACAILQFVNENYREPITIATAAAALYMSEVTIANLVEKNFRCTFSQLVLLFRLWVAAGLLTATPMLICDIALTVGFDSQRTFRRCFAAEFGTSPTSFREKKGARIPQDSIF